MPSRSSRRSWAWATTRFDEAIAEGERALGYDPSSRIIVADQGCRLAFAARCRESAALLRELIQVRPDFYRAHYFLGHAMVGLRDFDAAAKAFETAASLETTDLTRAGVAYGLAMTGRKADAGRILEELVGESRIEYVSAHAIATIHVALGDRGRAFEWLQRAYDERAEGLSRVAVDPLLEPIRSDPRFPALLRQVGLRR